MVFRCDHCYVSELFHYFCQDLDSLGLVSVVVGYEYTHFLIIYKLRKGNKYLMDIFLVKDIQI